jgi:hypothetical protein
LERSTPAEAVMSLVMVRREPAAMSAVVLSASASGVAMV